MTKSYRQYIEVECSNCRIHWNKRKDSLNNWQGKCRSCAQTYEKNQPYIKNKSSVVAKKQMLKQWQDPRYRLNMSNVHKGKIGEQGSNWKGGLVPITKTIRGLNEYKDWRATIFKRDNYICQKCGRRGRVIHAHHNTPLRQILAIFLEQNYRYKGDNTKLLQLAIKYEPFWDINNGKTMCKECHFS